jgi:2-aminoethylphosphonate-pyruvate transaminase
VILLSPGPVNVSPRVRAASQRADLCHREPECAALMTSIRERLVRAFAPRGGFTAVVITGSGTAALEAAVTSALSERGRLLVVANGVYGERIAAIAAAARLPHSVAQGAWTVPPDLDQVARAVREPDVEVVAIVQHETTTGLVNPVAEIGQLARRHGKLLLVDAVSALGGDALDVEAVGADLVVGTAAKCIQGLPGMAFVLVREGAMARLVTHPRRSVYLSLPAYHEAQLRGSTPFTPAVQVASAFEEALAELLEEGLAARIARYAAAARLVRAGCERLGLACVLPAELRSNSLTALWLPEGRTYADLHDALKARGFVVYEGQGRLERAIFRVANMGHLTSEDFTRFVAALGEVLADGPDEPRGEG